MCDDEHDRLRCAHPGCGAVAATIRWTWHPPRLADGVFLLVVLAFIAVGAFGARAWRTLDPSIAVRAAADGDGIDPWGRPLERKVVFDPTLISGTHRAVIYSRGANGSDDGGRGDDVPCPPARAPHVRAYDLLPGLWTAFLFILGTCWALIRWVGRSRRRGVDAVVYAAQVLGVTTASIPFVKACHDLWLPTLADPVPRMTLVTSWTATLCTLAFLAAIAVGLGRARYGPIGLGLRTPR